MTRIDMLKRVVNAMERPGPEHKALVREHGLLLRQLAGLQQGVGEQLQTQARHITGLEGEVLRLRAQLITARTCLLWGLPHEGLARVKPRRRPAVDALNDTTLTQAHDVICQTGCVGHAHPWLEADGQCRRTGVACKPLNVMADAVDRSLAPAVSDRAAEHLPMVVDLKR